MDDVSYRLLDNLFPSRPLKITDDGVWLGTPLDVIRSALHSLPARDGAARVLDAGMGDGRFVAALSIETERRVYGIESYAPLFHLATRKLTRVEASGIPARWRIAQGSYLETETYRRLDIDVGELDVVLNYPDGNEGALATFLSRYARPATRLCLLTPDSSVRLEELELQRSTPIGRDSGRPPWHLFVYTV